MATKINFGKHIREGWTVGDFITDLEPQVEMIMTGRSWMRPFKTKAELRKWVGENQPYYKKPVPEVVNYFATKFGLK